jgi:hypothetical protein
MTVSSIFLLCGADAPVCPHLATLVFQSLPKTTGEGGLWAREAATRIPEDFKAVP